MSGAITEESHKKALEKAAAEGFEVIVAKENELLLDLDTKDSFVQYKRVIPLLNEYFNVKNVETWSSKSGNVHKRITLGDPLSWEMRYLLQSALGSDGKREVLSALKMMYAQGAEASVLFKPVEPKEIPF
jgi:hypothetical protein